MPPTLGERRPAVLTEMIKGPLKASPVIWTPFFSGLRSRRRPLFTTGCVCRADSCRRDPAPLPTTSLGPALTACAHLCVRVRLIFSRCQGRQSACERRDWQKTQLCTRLYFCMDISFSQESPLPICGCDSFGCFLF